jgi:hypothetical protein
VRRTLLTYDVIIFLARICSRPSSLVDDDVVMDT